MTNVTKHGSTDDLFDFFGLNEACNAAKLTKFNKNCSTRHQSQSLYGGQDFENVVLDLG